MRRFAFTMLELVFVIIVVGILSVLAMPNMQSNPLDEAAEQIANHIRYTQHLAMVDNKFDPANANWFQTKWQIRFNGTSYVIFSDLNRDNTADNNETAIDPITGTRIDGANGFALANLANKYDINNVAFNNCGNQRLIAFDNLGRPYSEASGQAAPTAGLLRNNNCNITFTSSSGEHVIVRVTPETGYVCVLNEAGTACR